MNKNRISLLERAGEAIVRDPAARARLQVSELDKAAKNAEAKRKQCNSNVDKDLKEIKQVDDQVQMLKERYDPLCEHLIDAKERRRHLQETLEACLLEEKKIMGNIKDMAHARFIDDFKLNKQTASRELQMARGFNIGPDSTYRQKKRVQF